MLNCLLYCWCRSPCTKSVTVIFLQKSIPLVEWMKVSSPHCRRQNVWRVTFGRETVAIAPWWEKQSQPQKDRKNLYVKTSATFQSLHMKTSADLVCRPLTKMSNTQKKTGWSCFILSFSEVQIVTSCANVSLLPGKRHWNVGKQLNSDIFRQPEMDFAIIALHLQLWAGTESDKWIISAHPKPICTSASTTNTW